jgi:hypothetical protein
VLLKKITLPFISKREKREREREKERERERERERNTYLMKEESDQCLPHKTN